MMQNKKKKQVRKLLQKFGMVWSVANLLHVKMLLNCIRNWKFIHTSHKRFYNWKKKFGLGAIWRSVLSYDVFEGYLKGDVNFMFSRLES